MTRTPARSAAGQGGFTLVELIITLAITALLMVALTSVVLTSTRAVTTAANRIEASSQIRSFQVFAYDDFARSSVPTPSGCGTSASPCTTQQLILTGELASNSYPPVISQYTVTYTWDGSNFLDRQGANGGTVHAASGVTAFTWYVDTSGGHSTVVTFLTVTVGAYSESQTLRFYPRLGP